MSQQMNGQPLTQTAMPPAPPNTPPTVTTAPLPDDSNSLMSAIRGRVMGFINTVGKSPDQPTMIDAKTATAQQMADVLNLDVAGLVALLSEEDEATKEAINAVTDEKEHVVHKSVKEFILVICYASPVVLSILIGFVIGLELLGGKIVSLSGSTWVPWMSDMSILVINIVFDFMLAVITYGIMHAVKNIRTTGRGKGALVGLLFAFALAGTSVGGMIWLVYNGATLPATFDFKAMLTILRAFGLPFIELVVGLVAPMIETTSLERQLSGIHSRNSAKRAINKAHVEDFITTINSAIGLQANIQKEKDYQKKNQLANELIEIFGDFIITNTRKNFGQTTTKGPGENARDKR